MGPDDEALRQLSKVSDELRPASAQIAVVAGFRAPADTERRFRAVHRDLTDDPLADHLSRLRQRSTEKPDWLAVFTSAVLDRTQDGLAAAHHHYGRVVEMNRFVTDILRVALREVKPERTTTVAYRMQALDFEYQAFHFAIRRTLDYFAGSIAAYFKQHNPRIRGLASSIERVSPADRAAAVRGVLDRHSDFLAHLVSSEERLTVRDRVAHFEPIPAGVFNVVMNAPPDGDVLIGFAGGGEDLELVVPRGQPSASLTDVLQALLAGVERVIFETYQALGLGDGFDY